MMRDTVTLYIFILVYVALIFIQGHRDARKQKLVCQSSHFFNGCGLKLVYSEDFLV